MSDVQFSLRRGLCRPSLSQASTQVDVLFLCAEWCGVCRDLKGMFEELSAIQPSVHWTWVDVEDHSEIFDDLELDTFPSLLVMLNKRPWFFGSIEPRKEVVLRIVTKISESPSPMLSAPIDATVVKLLRSKIIRQ
jgi:thioredoxin 1